jgi:hypothetical protein
MALATQSKRFEIVFEMSPKLKPHGNLHHKNPFRFCQN